MIFEIAASPTKLPRRLGEIIYKLERGDLRLRFEHHNLADLLTTLDKTFSRLSMGIIAAAMIIGSSLFITTGIPLTCGPQRLIILDADPVVGAEFIPVFTAPFHLGQGGCAQMVLAAMVDLSGRCIAQADIENGAGFEGLGRLEAHAALAVIEGHGSIFAVKLGAERRDNKRRMRPDAFIFPLIDLNPWLVDFFIRLEFVFLLDRQ